MVVLLPKSQDLMVMCHHLKWFQVKRLCWVDAEETISGDGTDITFEVGSNGDINIPANIGLTFGDDGEKIEGDKQI